MGRTSDGRIWYVDYAQGYLGSYNPETKKIREWKTPSKEAGPYAMAVDNKDRIWFVETIPQPNRFVGFDPMTEDFFSQTDIPSGGGSVRHMVFDPPTNAIWFGTDTGNIGRARLTD
jgi:virginiamycin B lyase